MHDGRKQKKSKREGEADKKQMIEEKNKTMERYWSAFILPTDIMPQKQFHNLICMGLF